MSAKFVFRRAVALIGMVALAVGTAALGAAPAQATTPESQLTVSPSTAHPGDVVTVTQTVTNNLASTLAQPVARLLSGPDEVPLYATLQSCTGALSCSVLTNASGRPIGFEAVLP